MPPRPRTALLSRLLLAVFLLVAGAPPSGLGVCIGDDGHVHFGTPDDVGDCLCEVETDSCSCATRDHGHTDLAIEVDEVLDRKGNEDLVPDLPDRTLLPDLGVFRRTSAAPRFARGRLAAASPPRTSAWTLVLRSIVMRS